MAAAISSSTTTPVTAIITAGLFFSLCFPSDEVGVVALPNLEKINWKGKQIRSLESSAPNKLPEKESSHLQAFFC